ncbi:loricrin, putative [Trichomonas vaginalis G3]|uniref:receptor protein-tyrosine kinase n=1 Tax=Trichomonas vaginalis (strain ATCC PRA-98 / G3) TaxID=412133 RepID=A2E1U5_TRIV3|nr:glycine-rich protein family [Trichomonas vaginalis G3]EAY13424.1 loricrin, putative [Trichomonas vaginalis G3]KAI5528198.1 glycine-rich protein family [Trichomonas vaginalis G3]|eukprot:XP_001325647.1 loricrin [Trichomonas vaginalis G3]
MNIANQSLTVTLQNLPVDNQYADFQKQNVTLKYPCSQETNKCNPYKIEFKPGLYFIELWGASGGYSDSYPELGGYGAYASGFLPLPKKSIFYIYLGQQGKCNGSTTFNGGGRGTYESPAVSFSGSGGGASDMRITPGEWSDLNSLKSRIIVSAGGAGSLYYYTFLQGGHAGAINGYGGLQHQNAPSPYTLTNSIGASNILGGISCMKSYLNPSDTINGSFGIGASPENTVYGAGGGGGYYGGGAGTEVTNIVGSGSGGSSFISGYKDCNAISKDYQLNNQKHTNQPDHYSGYIFANPVMKDGLATQYIGNGKARITVVHQNYFNLEKSCVHFYIPNRFSVFIFIVILFDS